MSIDRLTPPPTPWKRIVGVGLVLAVLVSIVVLAFSWPTVTSSVRGVPLSIAGPAAAVTQVESALTAAAPDTFAFAEASDRAEAVSRIEHREAYGAIVLGADPEVLTSSAASPIVSQLLTGLAPRLQAQLTAALAAAGAPAGQAVTVAVTDVVPLAASDPRGVGLTAAAFPLTLGGMLGGILASTLIVGAWRRVVAISVYVVVGGLALGGILQGWFGALQGDYLANSGAIALTLLAVSATIVGVSSLVGRAGIAVGPVLFLLIANPLSAATQPLEFLPAPWGAIGQWFPPGAGATLLRDLSYFPSASVLFPWLVLAGWAVLGLALALIGHFREGVKVDFVNEVAAQPRPLPDAAPAHARHAVAG
ncbi:ABC transporter permease [Subtercola boreus]|uniref:ABC transporter permease n=1 Tax=Subtercola boreus TaxID=120213 RepID=A0A3E0W8B3_9MICO|nr:ABC transporter permease [Subtercola boreus]RFA18135.1 hypothetical protein B7R24_15945 [Subtercola boreus]RFA18517.1 hypothetical protein B7R23_15980 [Subtercola boreus]RFA25045.1 hypothetical protein B7R25_15975 [Subtercola boreus]